MSGYFRRPESAFSLDPYRKGGRIEDAKHLAFVRGLRCLVTGAWAPCDAAHIRYGDGRWNKPHTGMGAKPDDCWVVPLNHRMHMTQHAHGERTWWEALRIDPLEVAVFLFQHTGDRDECLGFLSRINRQAQQERAQAVLEERPPWARR